MRATVRTTGELLITAGVVVLLFCVYELYGTGVYTAQAQRDLGEQLRRTWAAEPEVVPPAPPRPGAPAAPPAEVRPVRVQIGDGLAVLRIPRLGADWAKVVVEGTDRESLKKGPGHGPASALPGETGNSVISGHRTTYGAPFNRLDELRRGDAVVVETRTTWYTYRVRGTEIVAPTDVAVVLPVPRRPGARPTEALLTLTTCHPEYSARQRLIVAAVLEDARPTSAGPPPSLPPIEA